MRTAIVIALLLFGVAGHSAEKKITAKDLELRLIRLQETLESVIRRDNIRERAVKAYESCTQACDFHRLDNQDLPKDYWQSEQGEDEMRKERECYRGCEKQRPAGITPAC